MTIILQALLTYITMSLTAGVVAVALGDADFAAKWFFTPPVGLILAGGASLFIAFVWWG